MTGRKVKAQRNWLSWKIKTRVVPFEDFLCVKVQNEMLASCSLQTMQINIWWTCSPSLHSRNTNLIKISELQLTAYTCCNGYTRVKNSLQCTEWHMGSTRGCLPSNIALNLQSFKLQCNILCAYKFKLQIGKKDSFSMKRLDQWRHSLWLLTITVSDCLLH